MAKCAIHKGRGRAPKGCPACAAGFQGEARVITVKRTLEPVRVTKGYSFDPITQRPQCTTADGMIWLDLDGNEPKIDAKGQLTESFVLQRASGQLERWGIGTLLPMTVAAFAKCAAEMEAAREKMPMIHKRKLAL
jgi:hypothetical protein